jgi:hypothetical protein
VPVARGASPAASATLNGLDIVIRPGSLPLVTLAYLGATLVMTWPLAAGLTRDLPADLGDSLLNCYLLDWSAAHLGRAAQGDWRAFQDWQTPGMFHPEPLTIAYSDHLLAQALQILPVYLATGNLILCYNLLFLSTFVLSALGTFVVVRQLTGNARAAFLAGLCYAFAPFRVAQFTHLQILSSQWMPFVLAGIHRFVETRRRTFLLGAAAALAAQNLSSSYFMVLFAPFAVAYAGYELWRRGLARDRRVWTALGAAFLAAALVTAPFMWPYLEARALGVPPRGLDEVRYYSADLLSYLTTTPSVRVWGGVMQAFPKPEGELFPGLVPALFGFLAVAVGMHAGWRRRRELPRAGGGRRVAAALALTVALAYTAAFGAALVTDALNVGFVTLRLRGKWRLLLVALAAWTALLALSRRARAVIADAPRSATAFYATALLVAVVLSCGPTLFVAGEPRLDPAPYLWLYRYVPGFDGLRVPARFGMLAMLFLAILAGVGAAAVERRLRRAGALVTLVGGLVFLVEAAAVPIAVNVTAEVDGYLPLPPRVYPAREAPPVYRFLRTLPAAAVIVEWPFGIDAFDLRAVYYATVHRRRLVNGYSGYFPPSYARRAWLFGNPVDHPDEAWRELVRTGATHALLHEGAYRDDRGARIAAWLEQRGAVEVARFGDDRVFSLPSRP